METTTQTPPETKPQAPLATAELFPSIEETRKKLEDLTEKAPSPMPSAAAQPGGKPDTPADQPAAPAAQPEKLDLRSFEGLKDYKGRAFDPRLHRVKANGRPDLNADGTLKILPPSKRGVVDQVSDRVKGFFNTPKSDHELTAEQEESAEAQARSISQQAQMEASAEFLKNGYFIGGELVAGPGFYTDYEKREAIIRGHFMVYEKATGKAFDPPPWLVLLVGLGADFKTTVSTVPECQDRLGSLGEKIVNSAVKGAVRKTFLGRFAGRVLGFFGKGKKAEAKESEKSKPAEPAEFQPASQFPEVPQS